MRSWINDDSKSWTGRVDEEVGADAEAEKSAQLGWYWDFGTFAIVEWECESVRVWEREWDGTKGVDRNVSS